mmetsp:Transcript_8214/g.10731  ORF Transcript_8214/g.10731 Transcript_8214/m.10731 type:complete len:277 (-) Transcript_8214:163-993(-)|eukprot:CAMPEP_0198151406 /NCGR_PEP_ID=MMETSP1443-20131203/55528_1 /TAXON_ID=186043 /ORGANISM="Entomoneis sp., Strain CCMP2396" /LENGTH=276 /DNA_ID=CAMNT_0043817053 /DNA_START=97 /DNA_END=927 /DNA_ORIENTATION=-
MNECALDLGSYAARTECIVTYGGSTKDVILNYTVLVLDVVACVVWLWVRRNDDTVRAFAPLISLAFVVAFQISLCLAVACSGISIIWCACFGWYLYKTWHTLKIPDLQIPSERNGVNDEIIIGSDDVLYDSTPTQEKVYSWTEVALGLLNVAFLLYYAMTAETIITVAHFCAIFMGSVVSLLEEYCTFFDCGLHWLFLDNFMRRRESPSRENNSGDPLLSSSAALFAPPTESMFSSRSPELSSTSASSSWFRNSFFRSNRNVEANEDMEQPSEKSR